MQRATEALRRGATAHEVDNFIRDESAGLFTSAAALRQSPDVRDLAFTEGQAGREAEKVRLRDVFRSAAQGATFGFADELAGVGAALVPGGRNFAEATEAVRANEERFRAAHPRIALMSEIGGAVATSFLGGAAIARAGTRGARGLTSAARAKSPQTGFLPGIARGAAAGGVEGAVESVGRAEGGLLDRAGPGGVGGLVGGVVGGALPAVGTGIRTARRIGAANFRPEQRVVEIADRELAGALGSRPGGFAAARRALTEIESARPGQSTLADISPETQSLLDTAVSASPQAREVAGEQFARRQAGQARRLIRDLEQASGGPPNVKVALEEVTQELQDLGAEVYEPLRRQFRDLLQQGQNPQAVDALKAFLERPRVARAFRAIDAIEQMVDPNRLPPTFDELQRVRKTLGRAADRLRRNDPQGARSFRLAAREMTELMEKAIPGFKEANRRYASLATVRDALEAAPRAWRDSTEQIAEQLAFFQRRGGDRAANNFRLAMLDGLIDDIRGIASNRQSQRRFTAPTLDFGDNMKLLFPDDDTLQEILRRAEIENVFSKTAQAGGGSDTARRLAAFGDLVGGADFAGALATGGARGGVTGFAGAALGEAQKAVLKAERGLLPQVGERIGEALTLRERGSMLVLLRRLELQQVNLMKKLDRRRVGEAFVGGFFGREAAAVATGRETRLGALIRG